MEVILNDHKIETSARNISELIYEQGLPMQGLAVAVDKKIIRRQNWDETLLHGGERITLIRATHGG